MRQHLRTAAATFQIACGVLAVLGCAAAVTGWLDPSGKQSEGLQGPFLVTGFVLGLGLLILWALARVKRRWLVLLTVVTAALAAVMLVITVLVVRPVRFDLHRGLWTTAWTNAVDTLLWLLIVAACVVELRVLPSADDDREERPQWQTVAAAVAPLALLTALVIIVVMAVPSWMVRANSRVASGSPAVAEVPSTLSGSTRWTADISTDSEALPTQAGLAVPVAADRTHSAGVVMIDPTTGRPRWRYQLRGLAEAPDLSSTEGGRAVVVDFDIRDAPDVTPQQTFTLSADTGRIRAFWPGVDDEPQGNDPPVLFDHVARGTNSVIAFSPTTGHKLWRYKPERCADPRGVASTPTVMIVTARKCSDGYELIGLDARTGDRRWVQPTSHESPVTPALVRPGYQLEMGGDGVQRRSLDTGTVGWTTSVGGGCGDTTELVADSRTWFDSSCDESARSATISAYDLADGRQLWQQEVGGSIVSQVAVDNERVLALTSSKDTCAVSLVSRSGSRKVLSFPAELRDSTGSTYKPGRVRCAESSVLRVGGSYVLRLRIPRDPATSSIEDEPVNRFVGLG